MEECRWNFRLFNHYFMLTNENTFKIKGKRHGCWKILISRKIKPSKKSLEKRIEVLEKLSEIYYNELFTHETESKTSKGKRISKIDIIKNLLSI